MRTFASLKLFVYFYPRSPCGERPKYACLIILSNLHFYPRSPCGERLGVASGAGVPVSISIHALLAESDVSMQDYISYSDLFLSTLSLRRATYHSRADRPRTGISIHALLAESDADVVPVQYRGQNFYPRSPCGERRFLQMRAGPTFRFLSTLSLRRATPFSPSGRMTRRYFYPRSPCGERRAIDLTEFNKAVFLSTLSLRRATGVSNVIDNVINYFYPRSPCGERRRHQQ